MTLPTTSRQLEEMTMTRMSRFRVLGLLAAMVFVMSATTAEAGLLDRLRCRCAAKRCCKPQRCCKPVCCQPRCCEPAPCCEPQPCCKPAPCQADCGCMSGCGCGGCGASDCGCGAATEVVVETSPGDEPTPAPEAPEAPSDNGGGVSVDVDVQ